MAYSKQVWNNGDSSTPLSAERLNHIEAGIAGSFEVGGPRGEKGDPGQDGVKGDKGDPGFGTEAQYTEIVDRLNDIESRLDALESPAEG